MGWVRGDQASMWRALAPRARAVYPQAQLAASYRAAERAAGVRSIKLVAIGGEHGGGISVAVAVRTTDFGTLGGTVVLPVSGAGSTAGVDWDPSRRLPGLRRGERVKRRVGPAPARGAILAADGSRLDATVLGALIA